MCVGVCVWGGGVWGWVCVCVCVSRSFVTLKLVFSRRLHVCPEANCVNRKSLFLLIVKRLINC